VIILTVAFEDRPRISERSRSRIEHISDDIWRVSLRYGFVEIPDIPATLAHVKGLDCRADVEHAIFFGARDLVVAKRGGAMAGWRLDVFAWLFRNAVKAVDRFRLPPHNVIEIAREIEI
jgi:KUP system potassium uptake protein